MLVINATAGHSQVAAAPTRTRVRDNVALSAWAAPALLFAVGLFVRLGAMLTVRFPLTEGSAYYVAVARNLASGRGLVIDAMWSYATPPLTLPRPAFELWQPLASLVAAAPMSALGQSYAAAQLGFALVGALLAPLTWLVARDAARHLGLPDGRASWVSIGAGLLVAVGGPFVLTAAVPDSTLPFTMLAVAACIAVPAATRGDRRAIVALGVLLGLAYLTRMEAVYVGLAFVAVCLAARIGWSHVVGRGFAVAAVAAAVAMPWWVRNVVVFGRPMPGQLADNVLLARNEQIFAYREPPTLDGFLAQGPAQMAGNIVTAFRHDLIDVVLVPGGVAAVLGMVALVLVARRRRELAGSSLSALLIAGLLTFAVTSIVFPVATLWGTFEHAAGPLLVALVVLGVLCADALVARVRQWRAWPRTNGWLAPAALVALTIPLTLVQLTSAGSQARIEQQTFTELAASVPVALSAANVASGVPLISDRPIWLSDALHRPVIALPDEPVRDVLALAREFGAGAIVVVEGRGRYPAELSADSACFTPMEIAGGTGEVDGFVIAEACR